MIFYATIFAIYYISVILSLHSNVKFYYIGLILLFLTASLKGEVGTDTWIYYGYYDHVYLNGCKESEFEALFCYYISLLVQFNHAPIFINAINATLIMYLLLAPVNNNPSSRKTVLILIIPAFYLDFNMNGVRAGLAYSLIFYLLSKYYDKTSKIHAIGYIIPFGIHSSSAAIYTFFGLAFNGIRSFRTIFIPFFIITGFLGMVYVYRYDLILRFLTSLEVPPYGLLSGYAPAILNFALIFCISSLKKISIQSVMTCIVLNSLLLVIARYAYVGIRLLDALYFVLCMVMIFSNSYSKKMRWSYSLIALSIFDTFLRIRNFVNESGLGDTPSPFIPYKFFWEI